VRLLKVLETSFRTLADLSDRGRSIDLGIREMIVPFGGSNYVIRYEVEEDSVFIARIWHGLEDREP
jgi:plasmid stabilization system protein ParE